MRDAKRQPKKRQCDQDERLLGTSQNALFPIIQRHVSATDLLFGKHLLLRKGKRNYVVLTAK